MVAAPGHSPKCPSPWPTRLPLRGGPDVLSFLGRLQAGLPPYSPVFKSWIHCWKYLSVQVGKLLTQEAPPVPPHQSGETVLWTPCRMER